MKKLFLALAIISLCVSCNPYKKISYVHGVGEKVDLKKGSVALSGVPDPILKVGDLLIIIVNASEASASEAEAAAVAPFNLPWMPAQGLGYSPSGALSMGAGGLQSYLVDTEGYLTFPTLGKIYVAGMTKSELSKHLVEKLSKYLKREPIITIRYANFRITIIREEGQSINHTVDGEKISIFEALAVGGGSSLHARRDNVLLIRETANGRKTYRIDLRDKDLLTSPYYWLQQSDVLYIHADPQSARGTYFGQVENMTLGIIGTLMSMASFTISLISYLK